MRQRGVLCHCSPSRNKPFCDGSHLTAEITPDAPFEREHTAAHRAGREARGPCPKGRPLSIHVEHDDPHTGSELAWRGDECALYRCGEFPKNLSVMIPIEKIRSPRALVALATPTPAARVEGIEVVQRGMSRRRSITRGGREAKLRSRLQMAWCRRAKQLVTEESQRELARWRPWRDRRDFFKAPGEVCEEPIMSTRVGIWTEQEDKHINRIGDDDVRS